jgi:hypothetical protein
LISVLDSDISIFYCNRFNFIDIDKNKQERQGKKIITIFICPKAYG